MSTEVFFSLSLFRGLKGVFKMLNDLKTVFLQSPPFLVIKVFKCVQEKLC